MEERLPREQKRERGREDEETAAMISSGLSASADQGEHIQGLHVHGQCDLTEDVRTWRMRQTDGSPCPGNASSPGHSRHCCGPRVQNTGSTEVHNQHLLNNDKSRGRSSEEDM